MGNETSVATVSDQVAAYAVLGFQMRRGRASNLAGLSRKEVEQSIADPKWSERIQSFIEKLESDGNLEQFLSETFQRLVDTSPPRLPQAKSEPKPKSALKKPSYPPTYVDEGDDDDDEEEADEAPQRYTKTRSRSHTSRKREVVPSSSDESSASDLDISD